ncbi:unnamed protein product [Mucor hiemalis]
MGQFQKLVTLLLLALFALQIYAQEEHQEQNLMTVTLNNEQTKSEVEQPTHVDIEKEEDKKVTSTKEEDKKVSSKKEEVEEISKADSEEESKEDKPKEEEHIEVKEEEDHNEDKSNEPEAKHDDADEQQEHSTDTKESKSSEDTASSADQVDENTHKSSSQEEQKSEKKVESPSEEHNRKFHQHEAPEGYMGEEIDQYMEHDHSQSRAEEEEEDDISIPATTAAEEEPITADAANKTVAAAPSGPRPPAPQITGCKTQGQIALTYSEGPSDVTAKIVRQLTKAEARANFFVNATWLYTQQYAMVVQNIYNAGHLIGMTYRVPNDDPAAITEDELRRDIINNAHTIESLINVSPKYVRLHYTEVKDVRTEGILQDLGFVIVGYNLDSQDYFKKDSTGPGSINQIYEDTFVKYKDTYDAKGSFISIQYDLPYTGSLAAIPHVINTIENEGYTMVRLDGCLNDATPYKKSANGTEYVGDKFSFSQSAYHQGQKSVVIETAAEAAEADEKFSMQGLEASLGNAQQVSMTLFLVIVGAVFTLFL